MESSLSRKQAFWVLNGLPAVGPITLNRLLEHFDGDPRSALSASRSSLQEVEFLNRKMVDVLSDWQSFFDLEKEERQAAQRGVEFVSRDDADYPELLREISDPPAGLYRIGKYDFKKPSIAIVGTRHCTLYGQSVARTFARELAQMGFCITSGMARGIDTVAHMGALEVDGGSTVCVLGNGIEIVYPPENMDLYKEVQTNGAIVSEFPFGRRADRQTFPMRNRLVSGMSHAVIVVESAVSGGSMITARFAGEQGRLVCAIPGRIDQKASGGSHQLIRDGAMLLTSVDELMEELEHLKLVPKFELDKPAVARYDDLNEFETKIMERFEGGESQTVEDISSRLEESPSEIASTIMMLELKGRLSKRLDGRYEAAFQLK